MSTLLKTLTTDDCKKILFKVGMKFGVSPKLISERLLDAQDKCDMLNGEIPIEYLEIMVKAWMDAGQPDEVNCPEEETKTECHHQTSQQVDMPPLKLQPPFVHYPEAR